MLSDMTLVRGHVEGERIVFDEKVDLPEGAQVEVALLDDEDDLSADERAKIEAAIDVGLAQADRGEGIPVEDVLEYLRKR
jgi:predicted transcriptional regulator